MIIEIIQKKGAKNKTKSQANRDDCGKRVLYVFGATKHEMSGHSHEITKENIHFVGTSDNLMIFDPLFEMKPDGTFQKNSGKDADLSEIIESFEQSERNNTRAQITHLHIVMSLQDKETMTISQWKEAVDLYVQEMGYSDCTYVSCLHTDTKNHHAHIVLSTIENTHPHRVVNDSYMFRLSAECRDRIEQKFNLKHCPNPFTDDAYTLQNKEGVRQNKTKNVNLKNLRRTVSEALNKENVVTLIDFIKELKKVDVGVNVRLAKGAGKKEAGEIEGISFSQNGTKIKASTLGNNFQWPALSKLLKYDYSFDAERVEKLSKIEMHIGNMINSLDKQESKYENIKTEKPKTRTSLNEILADDHQMTYSQSLYIVVKTKKKKTNFKNKDVLRFNHEIRRELDYLYATALKPQYDAHGPDWEGLSAKQKREKSLRIMIEKFVELVMKWLFGDNYRTLEEQVEDEKLQVLEDIQLMTNRVLENLDHEWLREQSCKNQMNNEFNHIKGFNYDCYAMLDDNHELSFVSKPIRQVSNGGKLLAYMQENSI